MCGLLFSQSHIVRSPLWSLSVIFRVKFIELLKNNGAALQAGKPSSNECLENGVRFTVLCQKCYHICGDCGSPSLFFQYFSWEQIEFSRELIHCW